MKSNLRLFTSSDFPFLHEMKIIPLNFWLVFKFTLILMSCKFLLLHILIFLKDILQKSCNLMIWLSCFWITDFICIWSMKIDSFWRIGTHKLFDSWIYFCRSRNPDFHFQYCNQYQICKRNRGQYMFIGIYINRK